MRYRSVAGTCGVRHFPPLRRGTIAGQDFVIVEWAIAASRRPNRPIATECNVHARDDEGVVVLEGALRVPERPQLVEAPREQPFLVPAGNAPTHYGKRRRRRTRYLLVMTPQHRRSLSRDPNEPGARDDLDALFNRFDRVVVHDPQGFSPWPAQKGP